MYPGYGMPLLAFNIFKMLMAISYAFDLFRCLKELAIESLEFHSNFCMSLNHHPVLIHSTSSKHCR